MIATGLVGPCKQGPAGAFKITSIAYNVEISLGKTKNFAVTTERPWQMQLGSCLLLGLTLPVPDKVRFQYEGARRPYQTPQNSHFLDVPKVTFVY